MLMEVMWLSHSIAESVFEYYSGSLSRYLSAYKQPILLVTGDERTKGG